MKPASSFPHILIDRAAGVALHQQIYDGLRRAILAGLLRPGQRIPSTRSLSAELDVSRLPVLSAYDQLLHEGYLEGRIGSGTFVSAALPDEALRSVPIGRRVPRQAAKHSIPRARDEGSVRPFRVSLPALDQFPHAIWSRIVARQAHALTPALMAYGDPAGLGATRAAIAEHLRSARAVQCEAEHVLIVSGSQAALRICAAALLDVGHRVAIEDPGYGGARAAFSAAGARLVPVAVDGDGLDVSALDAIHTRIRAVYVTPSHQYPLGASMSAARRMALLDWAGRRGAWVIEDDYDSEYRYVSRPLGALQGMDSSGRVIYIGTFSKVLFPAIRVGYIAVPPALWKQFVAAREALDIFSPTLYQRALADFLNEGHFGRHLRRMRALYLRRRAALLAGLAEHCAEHLTVHNADAGLHASTFLRTGLRDTDVVQRMSAHGLTASALSECYAGPRRRHGLLLGFGGSSERRIESATQTLGEVLDTMSSLSALRPPRSSAVPL